MSAYILTYIYLKYNVYKAPEFFLVPKYHNPDHKIDCLHNTGNGNHYGLQ